MHKLDAYTGVQRSGRLLFGGLGGIQVWQIRAPERFYASVLTGRGSPVIMVSEQLVGTEQEMDALNWALGVIATERRGYSALIAAE